MRQLGAIGGPLDCVMDIGKSGQKMRLTRFDINNSFDADGSDPVFVAAARGNVVLPEGRRMEHGAACTRNAARSPRCRRALACR